MNQEEVSSCPRCELRRQCLESLDCARCGKPHNEHMEGPAGATCANGRLYSFSEGPRIDAERAVIEAARKWRAADTDQHTPMFEGCLLLDALADAVDVLQEWGGADPGKSLVQP